MYVDRKAYEYVIEYVKIHRENFYVDLDGMQEELTLYLKELQIKNSPTGVGVYIGNIEEVLKNFVRDNILYFYKNLTDKEIKDYTDILVDMYCFYVYLHATGKFVLPSNSEDGVSTHIQLDLANLSISCIYDKEIQRILE